ncbi:MULTISPECIES: helix-turn-helix domain-containing protein [unclassified Streptomyces]|uniref:helix-turn-helix domain-containing protein n=1 Tax=unclassified Streptomyces TaxID=2593676 RepID=UPI0036419B53
MLGLQLRDLRGRRAGRLVAKQINCSTSKLSRLERAESPPDLRDIRDLAAYYGLGAVERRELLLLAMKAKEPEWFEARFPDCTAQWMKRLMGLESQCAVLQTFEAFIISGLLQTEEYAREIIHNGMDEAERTPEAIGRRAAMRAERQERFFRQQRVPEATFLLDESVLRRQVGDDSVMRGQMQRLLDCADDPRVHIRIVPFKGKIVSSHASMTHLTFEAGKLPPIVYVEGNESADYHMQTRDVERFIALILRIANESALSRKESLRLILEARRSYS